MTDERFVLTRDRGYFPVLVVHRDDVAAALSQFGPEELRNTDEDGDPIGDYDEATPGAQKVADAISDTSMEWIARKLGDALMEGGDYWECLAYLATGFYSPLTDESQAAQVEADTDDTISGSL